MFRLKAHFILDWTLLVYIALGKLLAGRIHFESLTKFIAFGYGDEEISGICFVYTCKVLVHNFIS